MKGLSSFHRVRCIVIITCFNYRVWSKISVLVASLKVLKEKAEKPRLSILLPPSPPATPSYTYPSPSVPAVSSHVIVCVIVTRISYTVAMVILCFSQSTVLPLATPPRLCSFLICLIVYISFSISALNYLLLN